MLEVGRIIATAEIYTVGGIAVIRAVIVNVNGSSV
jgi:hypothetical protein